MKSIEENEENSVKMTSDSKQTPPTIRETVNLPTRQYIIALNKSQFFLQKCHYLRFEIGVFLKHANCTQSYIAVFFKLLTLLTPPFTIIGVKQPPDPVYPVFYPDFLPVSWFRQ